MPEKLMRWNGSEWVEVSLVRKEVESGNNTLDVGVYEEKKEKMYGVYDNTFFGFYTGG